MTTEGPEVPSSRWWPGGFHGFDVVVPHAAISQDAIAARAAWLQRHLGPA